jgi:phenylpropionate dioxygenase-like ring-hydroxylating dioxygenase large terminal subunit
MRIRSPAGSLRTLRPGPEPASAGHACPLADAGFIRDVWYVAALATEIRRGPLQTRLMGEVLSLSGGAGGVVLEGPEGWTARESEGLVWIHVPSDPRAKPSEDGPPRIQGPGGKVRFVETAILPGHFDDAVYGLLDPAHGPYVHASPLWRTSRTLKEKTKAYAPTALGFTMMAHAPVNSTAYRLIGGGLTVEIGFQLPALRSEWIWNAKNRVLGLTALTPVDAQTTIIRQIFYWDSAILDLVRPFARLVTRPFLQQDVTIMAMRQKGLKHQPRQMLIRDADQLYIWYQRLKAEWQASRAEGRGFENPVRPATLRWRT